MRIGVDARCLEWRRGGVARIIVNLLKVWQKERAHKFILYFQNYIPEDEFLRHSNFELKLLKGPKFLRKHRIVAEQLLMPFFLKKHNLDIFFATGYSAPLLFRSAKVVVAAWDISYTTHPEHFSWMHRFSLGYFSRKTCAYADGVITASTFDANQIKKYYRIKSKKILTVYLAADKRFNTKYNKSEIDRVVLKYNLPSKFILSMGVIQNRRNIDKLIKAFKKIKNEFNDFSFVLIGRNYTQPTIDIKSMMQEMIKEGRALYIPWVEDEDLVPLYQAASYYVCSSTVDGEALMLKESMQSGTPVITSPLLKDAIGGNGLIIDDPKSVQNTSKVLRIAMGKESIRKNLIKDGLKWTKDITWEHVANNILTFLESR
ncbi:MAG: glycosyltransferase family 4 protein [Nitrosomonadales bacterium]|nr:glycosyltransferase family 4 protein [Nitrosomonadales bacterium]